jgi:hypothetical protein
MYKQHILFNGIKNTPKLKNYRFSSDELIKFYQKKYLNQYYFNKVQYNFLFDQSKRSKTEKDQI